MSFTHDEISHFLTHYVTIGDTIKVDSHRIEEHSYLGFGELFLPNRSFEFSVHMVSDPQLTTSVCMTEPDDFGLFEILINQNFINPPPNTVTYKEAIKITCIRQLVRIAIEEMPAMYKDPSHSTLGLGQIYKQFPAALDNKPEIQAFYQNQFLETMNLQHKNTYFNLVATSLLQGAVNIREYEVDLECLRLVPKQDLVLTHWLTMKNHGNRAIAAEVTNRTNRLLMGAEYNGNVLHPEFEIHIEIH